MGTGLSSSMSILHQAPDACTLPLADRSDRLDEWDGLFRRHVRSVHRANTTRTDVELAPDPATAAETADLAMREAGCCSFFEFTLRAAGNRLQLTIEVPERYTEVLSALSGRAVAASAS